MPTLFAERTLTPIDAALSRIDRMLRTLSGNVSAQRPYPGAGRTETVTDRQAQRRIARLVRVNHAGEVCAQALYHGQAATARSTTTRATLQRAAQEEADHLAWCAQRLTELNDRTSWLDPFWYLTSFAIGAVAGLSGDRYSLGFVAETERQVIAHLRSHLDQLPEDDQRTRAILEQMVKDEAQHGDDALQHGGELPPSAVKELMRLTAKVMTQTTQYI